MKNRNQSKSLFVVVFLLLLAVPVTALADGARKGQNNLLLAGQITSGAAVLDVNTDGEISNFLANGSTDDIFEDFWLYRLAGETDETKFNASFTDSYVGNVATLTWLDVDGKGFDAQLVITLVEVTPGVATYEKVMTITDIADGSDTDISLFNYVDADVCGSAGSDSATSVSLDTIEITDGACTFSLNFTGTSVGTGMAVDAWPNIDGEFGDGAIDNFPDSSLATGLPFGPDDFQAVYQWDNTVTRFNIPDGGSQAFPASGAEGTSAPTALQLSSFTLDSSSNQMIALVFVVMLGVMTMVALRQSRQL